jgi:hypothetical protein
VPTALTVVKAEASAPLSRFAGGRHVRAAHDRSIDLRSRANVCLATSPLAGSTVHRGHWAPALGTLPAFRSATSFKTSNIAAACGLAADPGALAGLHLHRRTRGTAAASDYWNELAASRGARVG